MVSINLDDKAYVYNVFIVGKIFLRLVLGWGLWGPFLLLWFIYL